MFTFFTLNCMFTLFTLNCMFTLGGAQRLETPTSMRAQHVKVAYFLHSCIYRSLTRHFFDQLRCETKTHPWK